MLNNRLHLNQKVFTDTPELAMLRQGFGEGLLAAAEKNEHVVGLCADLTESTKMDLFRKRFPERFIEIGVAEQNLVGVAAGMASMGKIPFTSSYAMFSPGRNWEQIRTVICYNNVPVKIVGSHAGVSVGPDGGTHQAIEDIAITRVLPRMVVVAPCDIHEAKKATHAIAENGKPSYLRLEKQSTSVMTTPETPFEIGKAYDMWIPEVGKKADVAIVGCGSILYNALNAAEQLSREGMQLRVVNMHTIKPLDTERLDALAVEAGALVTVEEHQIAGGLGSAISEYLATVHPVPIEFIGVQDKFGQSGSPGELLSWYGMSMLHVADAVRRVAARK